MLLEKVKSLLKSNKKKLDFQHENVPSLRLTQEFFAKQESIDEKNKNNELNDLRQISQNNRLKIEIKEAKETTHALSNFNSLESSAVHINATINKINEIEKNMVASWKSDLSSFPQTMPSSKDLTTIQTLELSNSQDKVDSIISMMDFSEFERIASENSVLFHQDHAEISVALASENESFTDSFMYILSDSSAQERINDAAMKYAQKNDDEAESIILTLLANAKNTQDSSAKIQFLAYCLFDLYRCIGAKNKFEDLAMEYAKRFGMSPGEWYSVSESVAELKKRVNSPIEKSSNVAAQVWICPEILNTAAVAQLEESAGQVDTQFDWDALLSIEHEALMPLTQLFEKWNQTTLRLLFSNLEKLIQLFKKETANTIENTQTEHAKKWWMLRLNLLRLLGLQEQFDEVAIDYCIHFEESPPSWAPSKCCVVRTELDSVESSFFLGLSRLELASSVQMDQRTQLSFSQVALSGELQEQFNDCLSILDAASQISDYVCINCETLIRIDFSFANDLLSWCERRSNEGTVIKIVNAPRLVYVLLQMLGFQNVAQIYHRKS